MKTLIKTTLIIISLFIVGTASFPSLSTYHVQAETPPYAKWGRLAMQKAKERYPNAAILDYLHIGREEGTTSSKEKFKLWVKDKNKEFGLFIDIEFDKKTEKVIKITYKESAR
jgi:hypothetical protein